MGIAIQLVDKNGNVLDQTGDDDRFTLERYLPELDDKSSYCLRFVDPYGTTYFNELQMDALLHELAEVKAAAKTPHAHVILDRVEELGRRCQREPDLLVRFVGG